MSIFTPGLTRSRWLVVSFIILTLFVVNLSADGQLTPADFARFKANKEEFMQRRAEAIAQLRGVEKDKPFDPTKRILAIQQMEMQKAQQAAQRANQLLAAEAVWTEIGPNPIPNGQVNTGPQLAVSGRTIAIAVHPTNPDIVYVGTAQGGLYRTTNGGTTWTPLMDNAMSLAIGAIAIAPSSPETVYVGTGEPNFSLDSYFGVGVYRIDNASSASPTITGPLNDDAVNADIFTGRAISRILVHPTNPATIFVSTTSGSGGISGSGSPSLPSRGIYRSTDATSADPTFTKLTGLSGNANVSVRDMVLDPLNPNLLVCGVVALGGGIFTSTDALAANPTFTQTLTLAGTSTSDLTTEFAIHHTSGPNPTIYAASGDGSGRVFRSIDGGNVWTQQIDNNFCSGQCFYDIAIAVAPNDATRVYLGGSPQLVFGISTNSGVSFTNNATTASGLHVDSHAIGVSESNPTVVYFGSDGGIYKSTNSGSTWTSLNNTTFRATQFMGLAVHPTDPNYTIGGTQDNGTNMYRPDATWFRVDFGDGGYAVIDQNAVNTTNVDMYHTYFNASTLQGYGTVSTTAGAVEGGWAFRGCNGVSGNGIPCGGAVLFYAPLEQGPGNPNTIYYGANILYRSADKGLNHTAVSQNLVNPISAIGISPQNDNVRIVGVSDGGIFGTITGSSTLTNLDAGNTVPNGFIARAVIDPQNVNTAYVTLSAFGVNNIWKTTNLNAANPTWTAASTGIPQVPVNAFIVDPLNSNILYAGTDIGVYASLNGGTTWNPLGSGLPAVAVFDMARTPNNKIRIATHGRGMWEHPIVNTTPTVTIDQAVGQADPTSTSPINFTVVFSEAVNGFTGTDISFAGSTAPGTLSATVTGAGPTYNVAVSGMTGSGNVVASVPASVATSVAANEPNAASTSTDNTVTYNPATPPTVTINQAVGQVDPTSSSPINFTVVFSEAVSGFANTDISFTGSTAAGTLAATITGAGPTYNVAVSGMTGSGLVVASIPANSVTAVSSGLNNTASTSTDNTVQYNLPAAPPTVTIDQAVGQVDPTNISPIQFTVVFSEAVSGFAAGDISFTGSTAPGTLSAVITGTGPTYNIFVSGMTGSGLVVASIPAGVVTSVSSGTPNTASTSTDNTVQYNMPALPPAPCVEGFDAVAAPALPAGWTTSVTGSGINWITGTSFASSAPNGAYASGLPASVSSSTLLSPTYNIPAGGGQLRFMMSHNLERGTSGTKFDGMILEISINGGAFQNITTAGGTFLIGGYDAGNISTCCSNPIAGLQGWSGNSGGFVFVVVNLPAAANNQSVQFRWRIGTDSSVSSSHAAIDDVEVVCQGVTVTVDQAVGQVDPTNISPIQFTAVFSEAVTGFTASDISFAGSTAPGTLSAVITGTGPTYNIFVSGMTGSGLVVASIPAGVVTSVAFSLPNAPSTSTDNTVQYNFPVLPTALCTENFNTVAAPALPSGWTTSVTGSGINWITGTSFASSAPNGAYASGLPASVSSSTLLSPSYDIPAGGGQLRFMMSHNLERGTSGTKFDGMILEISINGGAFQNITTAGGTFLIGGYDAGNISTCCSNPIAGLQGWSGNSGGFVFVVVDLPAAANNQSVQFRWRIGTDSSVSSPHAAVDDVEVVCAPACTVTCPANIIVPAAAGQCGATVNYPAPTTTGTCGTITATPASGSFFPVGTTTVNVTSTAGPTCSFTITVTDNQLPSITCPSNVVVNNTPGQCSAIVNYTLPTATDNCPGVTVVSVPASGSTFPVGTTTVTATAQDAAGNTASCVFTVTVNDNQPPTITCPANISVSTAPGQCSAVVNYSLPTATDNCPGVTVVSLPASGSTFPRGTTTVTATATDASGNTATCIFTVTVNDNQPPTITCPANVVVSNTPGQCGAIVNFAAPTATDNCPGVTVVSVPASGSFFPVGTTTVTSTATDASGNTATCTFTVRVNDVEPPVITCPANISVPNAAGLCAAVVNYSLPVVSDNCPTPVQIPASFSNHGGGGVFTLGGNTAPGGYFFSITNTSAAIRVISSFGIRFGNPAFGAVAAPQTLTVWSRPGGLTAAIENSATGWTQQGPQVVNPIPPYFATGTGPLGTCNLNTAVTIAPGATASFYIHGATACPVFSGTVGTITPPVGVGGFTLTGGSASANVLGAGGHFQQGITNVIPNISIRYTEGLTLVQTTGLPSGATFPVGTTTNTYTATDAAGNTSSCSFTVTVNDTELPTITCPGNQTRNTDAGQCYATFTPPVPTWADNCAVTQVTWAMTGATTGSSPATGINTVPSTQFLLTGTTGVGVTTITYTARDAAGNTRTCSFTVTVNDASIPVISTQPATRFVCAGSDAVFSVTANAGAGNPLAYQWQQWNGSAWVNIAGATASTLTIPAVTFAQNTNTYRVVLTGRCSVVISGNATLYVNPLPTVTLVTSIPPALLPGQSLNISSNVSLAGGTYTWFKNGVQLTSPLAQGPVLSGLTVDDIGTYRLVYTDPNGCIGTSADVVITGLASDRLWIYPNPNSGIFQIRFYNLVNEQVTITIYDEKGARIYQRSMVTNTAYTRLDVNISGAPAGNYVVEVVNSAGRRIGAKKIIKRHI